MIFKSYLVEKNISLIDDHYAILFYGENIGLKDDFKNLLIESYKDFDKISLYQSDLNKNPSLLEQEVMNISLFNQKKIILINDYSDKLKNNIIEIIKNPIKDIKICLFSENLDRKSVIRSTFEKEKNLAVVPCYQDNERTLSFYLRDKLRDYQGLNQELANKLIKNSGEDRKVLNQEIQKIKGLFSDKKIDDEKLFKLINNEYNIDFDNLRDSCLAADKRSLNKNLGNFNTQNEKVYFYFGNINSRIQKLLEIKKIMDGKNDVETAMNNIKPKIFWKDKDIIKKQLRVWDIKKLEKAEKIILQTENKIKTKFSSLSDLFIKKMLIDLCNLANSTS